MLSLAREVLTAAGKDLWGGVARPGLETEYSGDHSRLLREIGPVSFTDMDQNITGLYEWYRVHKKDINPELLRCDK